MSRRSFVKAVAAAALGAGYGGCSSIPDGSPREGRPNFIIIMADDLGYGDLGCYGSEAIDTPHLDALAAGGLRFTDFHSNGAVCSPTRAALLTGRYQQRCGISGVVTAKSHRHTGMELDEVTFAEVLAAEGYRTALFGKWHLGYDRAFGPVKQGFDEFAGFVSGNVDYHSHIDQVGYEDWWHADRLHDEEGYTTDLITDHGLRFIEQNRHGPFCLYLAHECPHYPYQARADEPVRRAGEPGKTQGGRRDRKAALAEMIAAMDSGIGSIRRRVQELGLEKDTLIFFCSDNGPAGPGSAGPLRGKKGSLHEGGHRVPALAHWPGRIAPGTTTDQTAMTMDLFPTMVSLAKGTLPAGLKLDGVDISPLFDGRSLGEPRPLFWSYKKQAAMRQGPWKLVNGALYNLDDDLGEEVDLAEKDPARLARMAARYDTWFTEVTRGVGNRLDIPPVSDLHHD